MVTKFHDRTHAGEMLSRYLEQYTGLSDCTVVALPRGGVVIGAAVAQALGLPLEVLIVRKLGVPWQPELAMGAIAEGGFEVLDQSLVRKLGVSREEVEEVREGERDEMERRRQAYRGGKPAEIAQGTAILVDDGIATGATTEVAVKALRARGVRKVVLAVPVAPPETIWRMRGLADEVICLLEPTPFVAIGQWYDEFDAVPDAEVNRLLRNAHAHAHR